MSVYSTEKYKDILNQYGTIIKEGANCATINPSSKLVSQIEEFKQKVDDMISNIDWPDEFGENYIKDLKKISDSLELTNMDIKTNFSKGEDLYIKTETLRSGLASQVTLLDTLIKAEPIESSSKYSNGSSKYEKDYKSWSIKADNLIKQCDEKYDLIVSAIDEMRQISLGNEDKISIKSIDLEK